MGYGKEVKIAARERRREGSKLIKKAIGPGESPVGSFSENQVPWVASTQTHGEYTLIADEPHNITGRGGCGAV